MLSISRGMKIVEYIQIIILNSNIIGIQHKSKLKSEKTNHVNFFQYNIDIPFLEMENQEYKIVPNQPMNDEHTLS